jgi:Membrane protein involved in the export of O-antigen and teichoic acid
MASAIILLPFYVQDLSDDLYGKLAIFLAFSLFVQIVVTYSFDSSVYFHYHEYKGEPEQLADFISSAFVVMLIIAAAVGLILSLTGEVLFRYVPVFSSKNISFFPYGIASVFTGVFQAIVKVHSSFMQTRERPDIFLWTNSALFLLIAGLTILGLKLYPDSLVGPIGGRLIASFLVGAWVLTRVLREFGIRFRFGWLKKSLSFNNYIFIYQLEQWIINYFDRILMAFFLPIAFVGVYDFAIKCLVVIELIMNGLHNSFFPRIVSKLVDEKQDTSTSEINKYYNALIASVMILVCISILVFPVLIRWFIGKSDYIGAVDYIPFLAIVYLPRVVKLYFASPYGAKKYTKPLPVLYLIVSIIKISLMVLLINEFQVYGVIVASAVAAFSEVILLKVSIRRKFTFRYNVYKMIAAPLLVFAMVGFFEPSLPTQYELFKHAIYLFVCGAILWTLYRNEIILLYKTAVSKWSK